MWKRERWVGLSFSVWPERKVGMFMFTGPAVSMLQGSKIEEGLEGPN